MLPHVVFLPLVILILGPSQPTHGLSTGSPPALQEAKPYDFLIFSNLWQGTVCSYKKCKEMNMTDPSNYRFFNIHGLWPSSESSPADPPVDCNKTDTLILKKFHPDLQEQLLQRWNGLINPTKYFLNHEWLKHGTCWNPLLHKSMSARFVHRFERAEGQGALSWLIQHFVDKKRKTEAQLAELYDRRSQQIYFWSAMEVGERINYYQILKQSGIVPNETRTYQLATFREALVQELGISNIVIRCDTLGSSSSDVSNEENKIKYVLDIRVCLDLEYNPRDCPEKLMAQNDCGKDERTEVYYLPIGTTRLPDIIDE